MPRPTQEHIQEMGPEIFAFERANNGSKIEVGEDIVFENEIYNATEDEKPENVIIVLKKDIESNPSKGRYLWIINKEGLWIILESTKCSASSRGCVCHTNISGRTLALQGGELWFGEDDTIYINYRSGRFGGKTINHWIGVIDYFKYVGYPKVEVIL